MEQLIENKNIRLCYFTALTNKGVGYICMALQRPEKDSGSIAYKAAFSFCSPQEGKCFSKQKARLMAIGRLSTFKRGSGNRIDFECSAKNLTEVFTKGLEIAENTQFQDVNTNSMKWFVPNWVRNRKDLIFGLNPNKGTIVKVDPSI